MEQQIKRKTWTTISLNDSTLERIVRRKLNGKEPVNSVIRRVLANQKGPLKEFNPEIKKSIYTAISFEIYEQLKTIKQKNESMGHLINRLIDNEGKGIKL